MYLIKLFVNCHCMKLLVQVEKICFDISVEKENYVFNKTSSVCLELHVSKKILIAFVF